MGRIISIVSGKGGVGRTTAALNIGVALSNFGSEPVVVDSSFHTPNMSLFLGSPNLPNTLYHVLNKEKKLKQALYRHPSGLTVLPSAITLDHFENIDTGNIRSVLSELEQMYDFIILDSSPGMGEKTQLIIRSSRELILITTPDLPAIADAIRTSKMAERLGKDISGIILNKVKNDNIELSIKNVETILESRVIGIIPEDDNVRKAMHLKHPVVHTHPHSNASIGFKRIAAQLLGKTYVDNLQKEEEESLFNYTLRKMGL